MELKNQTNQYLLSALCGPAGRGLANHSLSELFGYSSHPATMLDLRVGEEIIAYQMPPQIALAKELMTRAMLERISNGSIFSSPGVIKDFLSAKLGGLTHEVFSCLYLDSQNHLIAYEELFRGTLTQTSVYPREVVKRAIELNASSIVFAHNHPSGSLLPSRADEVLTQTLKVALGLVDVRVIDHIIVGGNDALSMAERGLI